MRQLYIICLHDLEDITFYATEDYDLYTDACNADDLMVFVGEHDDELEYIGDDLEGIGVLGFTYGIAY